MVMSCDAVTSKKLTYQWFKDDILLPDLSRVIIKNDVKRGSSGNYRCNARHDIIGNKSSEPMAVSVHCKYFTELK